MERLIPRLSAAERTAFIAAARSLVGTPFRHCGRTRNGIDCLGVVAFALRKAGRHPMDERAYAREPEKDAPRLRNALMAHFGGPVSALQPGCVVSMHWHGVENHVAIVGDYHLGGLSLIHAVKADRGVIETRLASPWDRRVMEAWLP